jgi:hypothetical protein
MIVDGDSVLTKSIRSIILNYMDTTTKRPQPLVNLGSSLRDQLESVGASMTPPMRWQDLARQVIKNFVHSQVLAGALQDAQVRLTEGRDA